MKFKEISAMSSEEREKKLKDMELELIKLNSQVATGTPPKNPGQIRRIKKDIARLRMLSHLEFMSKEQKKRIGELETSKPSPKQQESKLPDKKEKSDKKQKKDEKDQKTKQK